MNSEDVTAALVIGSIALVLAMLALVLSIGEYFV